MVAPADLVEQSQWDFFWVPADVRIVDRPELLYVSCPRDVPLLNCVTRTRSSDPLAPLVEEVSVAHATVTSRWLVRDQPRDEPLSRQLSATGYAVAFEHGAFVMDVGAAGQPRAPATPAVLRGVAATAGAARQVTDMAALRDWYTVADAVFGHPASHPQHELDAFLEECTRPDARVHRFVAYDADEPVCCGGMTSFAALRFGYLWAGATVPTARGRGFYHQVLGARLTHAERIGLERVGLYARTDTSAPIVQQLGFSRHGTMWYWDRPPP